jgi:hypothetical protein
MPRSAFNLGKLLFFLEGLAVSYDQRALIHNLSTMNVENSFIDFWRVPPYNQFPLETSAESSQSLLRKVYLGTKRNSAFKKFGTGGFYCDG